MLTRSNPSGSQNDTPELCNITYPLLPLSKGVIPCIISLLNPLKIISAADQIFKPQSISADSSGDVGTEPSVVTKTKSEVKDSVIGSENTAIEGGEVSGESSPPTRTSTKYDPGPPPMEMIGGESRGKE